MRVQQLAQTYGEGAKALQWTFQKLYENGGRLFNFKNLGFHKSRWRGTEKPVFFATRGRIGLWEMLATLRACRII